MCGYSTDKTSQWDDDLDQCKRCSKEDARVQKIQDYLATFEVGDLVCWRDRLHVLVEKPPIRQGPWTLLDPTTTTMNRMFVRNWIIYSDCPNIREIIYKWTENDRS